MIYLKSFTFPTEEQESPILDYVMTKWHNTVYPFKIASGVLLETLEFAPVTILYGSNGSGKTTLLNVMAQKLGGGACYAVQYVHVLWRLPWPLHL